jgi:hypothetical protein
VKFTAAAPVPEAGELSMIHAGRAAVFTIHAHDGGVGMTEKPPLPPAAAMVPEVGFNQYEQTTGFETVRVTGIVAGELVAPDEVAGMVPLYVPADPGGLIIAFGAAGVVPLPGLTDSHAPPEAAIVKLSGVEVDPTESGIGAGATSPMVYVRVMLAGDRVNAGKTVPTGDTFNV